MPDSPAARAAACAMLAALLALLLLLPAPGARAAYLEGLLTDNPLPWPGRLARCAVGPATGGAWSAPAVADVTGDGIPDLVVGSAYGDVILYQGTASGRFEAPRLLLVGDVPQAEPSLRPAVPAFVKTPAGEDLLLLRGGRLLRYPRVSVGFASGREVKGPGGLSLSALAARSGAPSLVSVAVAGEGGKVFFADRDGGIWSATLSAYDLGPLARVSAAGGKPLSFSPPVSLTVGRFGPGGAGGGSAPPGGEYLLVGSGSDVWACPLAKGHPGAARELASDVVTPEGCPAERLAPAVLGPGRLVLGTRWGPLFDLRLSPGGAPRVAWVEASDVPIDCGLCAAPAAVDWDGDGRLDLVVAGADGRVRLFLALPDGTFRPAGLIADGSGPIKLPAVGGYAPGFPAFGDLGGTGREDLLVGCADGTVRVWRNTGELQACGPLTVGGDELRADGVATPELVDWDHDGKDDIIVGSQPLPASDAGEPGAPVESQLKYADNKAPRGAWCRFDKVVTVGMNARYDGSDGDASYVEPWQLRFVGPPARGRQALVAGRGGMYLFRLSTIGPAYPRLTADAQAGILRPWRSLAPVWSVGFYGRQLLLGLGPYGFVCFAKPPGR